MKLRTFTLKEQDWDKYYPAIVSLNGGNYLNMVDQRKRTTVLLERNDKIVGFISGYVDNNFPAVFGDFSKHVNGFDAKVPNRRYCELLYGHYEDYMRMKGYHRVGQYVTEIRNLWQQDKENNSAAYALTYLMYVNGYKLPLSSIEVMLKGTKEGVSTIAIEEYLEDSGIGFSVTRKLVAPCLVKYKENGKSQYGVILRVAESDSEYVGVVELYNPATGGIEYVEMLCFMKYWDSKWTLTIKPKINAVSSDN